MVVYVDEQRKVESKRRIWPYSKSCHMMADTDVELEKMARRLKLREQWRHGDHYDLTPNKRVLALCYGAKQTSTRKLIQLREKRRKR